MKIGFVIYGSLETVSGGYLYDRKLVEYLRAQGDQVEIISLPWRNYASHLTDNFPFRLPPNLDILIQDELNHPSLIVGNAVQPAPCVAAFDQQPYCVAVAVGVGTVHDIGGRERGCKALRVPAADLIVRRRQVTV